MIHRRNRRAKPVGKRQAADSRVRYHVTRLLLCLAVFLAVFVGKQAWPAQAEEAGRRMLEVIRSDTDLRAAFASLGEALSGRESVLGELGDFCVAVFGASPQQTEPALSAEKAAEVMHTGLFQPVADQDALTARYLRLDSLPDEFRLRRDPPEPEPQPEPETGTAPEPEPPVLRVGDVVRPADASGEPLPEAYSDQWLYLGDRETVTPVLGRITSGFGYREHPTLHRYAVHGGVDIGADRGTAVACFAAGTVERTGEDADYGKYLVVRHGDGVETLYAHCGRLCVRQGETVEAGQKIAEVGSTGQATGPHLHFEIRLNGTKLDPIYYIAQGEI